LIKEVNNFLLQGYFDELKTLVYSSNFPWYYTNSTVFGEDKKPLDDSFKFFHILWDYNKGLNSEHFQRFSHILYDIQQHIPCKELLRMKLNLNPNKGKRKFHAPHQDVVDIHPDGSKTPKPDIKIIILNFSSCNGATKIKDKEYQSQENKALIFPNEYEHQGISQNDTDIRIVLNIAVR